jgi:RNA polymerase sigma-70 factor (ECF subfamily)
MVRGLLSRTLGPSEDIEAAVVDIFFRAHQRRRRLAEAKHLRLFIVTATIDWLRWQLRLRRWRRALDRLLGSAPRTSHPHIDGGPVTVHRVALAELYGALDTLTAGQRLAFTLHFFEGLVPAESAAFTRSSVAAFERRLLAAGQKLGGSDDDLHRLARLARAASSRPLPTSTGRATRRRFLDRVARSLGEG